MEIQKKYAVGSGGKCVFANACNNFDSYITSVYELMNALNQAKDS